MLSFVQTVIFAAIQGLTELFPISSVAHSVITPYVFGWHLSTNFLDQYFLPYVVMLHVGTALALLVFFWSDWIGLLRSLFNSQMKQERKVLLMVITGTIPAGLIGLLIEKPVRHFFGDVTSAAIFLVLNGLLLFFGERVRGSGDRSLNDLGYMHAFWIGAAQSLALIPGFSRSGASMTAGFWAGLEHEEAARFSMLLAAPLIGAAALLEVPHLIHSNIHGLLTVSVTGGIIAGVLAYASVWVLMRWVRQNEITAMRPFAYYCWLVGGLVLISQLLHF